MKQPQTITLPPPCLTADVTHCKAILVLFQLQGSAQNLFTVMQKCKPQHHGAAAVINQRFQVFIHQSISF